MRKGKRVLITDGVNASGEMLVRSFASYGASTAFFYSNSYDKAIALSKEASALNIRCKISKLDSLWSALEVLRGYFDDELDTLVFNIDISDNTNFDNMDGDKWRHEVISEVDGLFYTIRAMRPFLNRKSSSIIITAAKGHEAGFACDILEAYIEGLTKSLSKSLNVSNISVNAIIYDKDVSAEAHIADAARQLASGESSFITGQVIRI